MASEITRVVPLRIGYRLCDEIGDLLFWRSRRYRLNVVDNLRHVYGPEMSERELRRQARRVFRTSARNFWDLARQRHLRPEDFERIMRLPINGPEMLRQLQAERRPCILLSAHVGAFDFVGQVLHVWGLRPCIPTTPTVGEFVYAAVCALRTSRGLPLQDVSPAVVRKLLQTLRQGGMVGMLADRDFMDTGMPVRFFGAETTLPSGPVRLALRTGAVIVPVFALREDEGGYEQRYAFWVFDPIELESTGDEATDLQRGMEVVAGQMEAGIRMAPEQWVMFQRVWPEQPRRWRRALEMRRRRERHDEAPLHEQAAGQPASGS